MENTIQNVKKFNTDVFAQFKAAPTNKPNQSGVVFFIVDVQELFNINLKFRGILGCLNRAFMESKRYVPVATGLLKSSYTMEQIDDHRVKCFFDPRKIIGKTRNGVVVKDYYPQYIAEHASRFNWLTIVMKKFYDKLYHEAKILFNKQQKKSKNINDGKIVEKSTKKGKEQQEMLLIGASSFMKEFNNVYKASKQAAKEAKKQEEEKKKAKKKQLDERKKMLKEQIKADKGVND